MNLSDFLFYHNRVQKLIEENFMFSNALHITNIHKLITIIIIKASVSVYHIYRSFYHIGVDKVIKKKH